MAKKAAKPSNELDAGVIKDKMLAAGLRRVEQKKSQINLLYRNPGEGGTIRCLKSDLHSLARAVGLGTADVKALGVWLTRNNLPQPQRPQVSSKKV